MKNESETNIEQQWSKKNIFLQKPSFLRMPSNTTNLIYFINEKKQRKEQIFRFINCLEQALICSFSLKNYTENFLIFFQNRDVLEKEDNVFFEEVREDLVYLKLSLERLEEVFLMIRDCSLKKSFLEERFGLSVFKKMLRERFFHGKINEELLNVNNTIFFLQLKISKKFSNREEVVLFFLNFKEKWEEVNNLWKEILQTRCLENEECFFKMKKILLYVPWSWIKILGALVVTIILVFAALFFFSSFLFRFSNYS